MFTQARQIKILIFRVLSLLACWYDRSSQTEMWIFNLILRKTNLKLAVQYCVLCNGKNHLTVFSCYSNFSNLAEKLKCSWGNSWSYDIINSFFVFILLLSPFWLKADHMILYSIVLFYIQNRPFIFLLVWVKVFWGILSLIWCKCAITCLFFHQMGWKLQRLPKNVF